MKILILNPTLFSGEKILRSERCQTKGFAGFGVWPPIGPAEIAALLERDGFHVTILDAVLECTNGHDMVDRIERERPDVMILHGSTPTFHEDLLTARRSKERLPDLFIAIYGLHATARPEDYSTGDIDCVIRGEPEETCLELCRVLRRPSKSPQPASPIPGVSIRNGVWQHAPDRPLLNDLDSLPLPARHLLRNSEYILPLTGRPFTVVKTSRGCPYRCIYCTTTPYSRGKWRRRSPQSLLSELSEVRTRHGIRDFLFLSDTFNILEHEVIDLCDLIIGSHLDIRWMCNSRVDTITEPMARKMKEAGCWLVSLGIESGSDEILRRARKEATTDDARRAVAILKRAGIQIMGYFMFGLPGECSRTRDETIAFAMELDPQFAHFYAATPLPGTEFYKTVKNTGDLKSEDWGRFYQGNSDVVSYEGFSSDDIRRAVSRAYRRFYLRPRPILRQLAAVRSFSDLSHRSRTALDFVRHHVRRPSAG